MHAYNKAQCSVGGSVVMNSPTAVQVSTQSQAQSQSLIENEVYRYAMNVFTTLHYFALLSSPFFRQVCEESFRALQEYWHNTHATLVLGHQFALSLVSKLTVSRSELPNSLSGELPWLNLLELVTLMRTYVLCSPTLGKSEADHTSSVASPEAEPTAFSALGITIRIPSNARSLSQEVLRTDPLPSPSDSNAPSQPPIMSRGNTGIARRRVSQSVRFGDLISYGPHVDASGT